jgi:general secretion pathway protein J
MSLIVPNRRNARSARHRSGELGFTLIELLLSLAILAILTGFLAGGLSIGRRAFDVDRVNGISSETEAAIQVVSRLIGSALPIPTSDSGQTPTVVFDGRQEAVVFVGLSEGRSLRGGPYRINLRRSGNDLVVEVISWAATANMNIPELGPARVVVLSGVSEVHFEYFGKINPAAVPGWRTEWRRAERLPDLVSVRVVFEDGRRNEPPTIVALRQE